MKIRLLEFIDGARNADGLTVIIDVFRAFSVACYAFDSGASRIIATGSVDEALRLRNEYRNSVVAGERNEKKPDGFDFGNSPTEILKADIRGKTLIHTTTAGTSGLVNAAGATSLITGSLVNAGAIVKYIKLSGHQEISLVAMGYRAEMSAAEDILCAELIRERLLGNDVDLSEQISALRFSSGSRFFDPGNIEFSPPTDFFLCTMTDRFDFVIRAERRFDGNIDLMKIEL